MRASLLLAFLATLSTHPATARATPSPGCGRPGHHYYSMTWGGIQRTAIVRVPKGYAGGARPLVIGLGGAGDTGRHFEVVSGLGRLGANQGFVTLFPTATGARPFWNISASKSGADDVGYIGALIDQLEATGCVDSARVYATGVSNGGGMSALLGCELADKITAIAPVAGGYKSLPACDPVRPLSVLEIHGSRDPIVPYAGIPPDRLGSVPRFLVSWAQRDGCAPRAKRSEIGPATIQSTWTACAPGLSVTGIKLYGAGHLWPGETPPSDDQGPSRLNAAATVWQFFKPLVSR